MAGSQKSFEDRIGKYKAGDALIQSWADYTPSSALITKAANTAFITSVEGANLNVVTKKQTDDERKHTRLLLCFTQYDENSEVGIINPDCAELRIIGVHSYLSGTLAKGSPTIASVKLLVDTIRPKRKGTVSDLTFTIPAGGTIFINNCVSGELAKNTGTTNLDWNEVGGTNPVETVNPGEETTIIAPSGNILVKNLSNRKAGKFRVAVKTGAAQTNSTMEKTFASIDGFMSETIALIGGIGGGIVYNPPDPKLTVAELTALRNLIRTLNDQVANANDLYGFAIIARKTLYDGLNGMTDRIAMIKSYLASFPLKKKSSHFVEFSQAIKGT